MTMNMTPETARGRAAFEAAFRHGDVAAIDAYMARPDVAARVAETESACRQGAPMGLRDPWFRHLSYVGTRMLPGLAVKCGHLNVLRSLFTPEKALAIGATLVRIAQPTLEVALRPSRLEALEWFLKSPFYLEVMTAGEKQTLLNGLLKGVDDDGTSDVVGLLVAHGADVNAVQGANNRELEAFRGCASDQRPLHLATWLASDGACIVGADVLGIATVQYNREDRVRELIRLGVDSRSWEAEQAFYRFARAGEIQVLEALLREGCIDVDARSESAETALMLIANEHIPAECVSKATRLLLRYGADPTARDANGFSPLHYALFLDCTDTVELLLAAGADPNARTPHGALPHDGLHLDERDWTHDSVRNDALKLLLQYGLDPLRPGLHGQSLDELLSKTPAGQAFVSTHGDYFTL